MEHTTQKTEYGRAMTYAVSCKVMWGLLPFYWQMLRPIDSWVIILYRIVLVGLCCFAAALKMYGWKGIKSPLTDKMTALKYFLAGVLITSNWSLYIWAVNADHVIQTSIGYYMEPIIICAFGVVLFHEKFTKYKLIAFVMACAGVLILLIHFREIPFIAVGLGTTFAVYAAIKKSIKVPAVLSLLYETMFLVLPALIAIIVMEMRGAGAFAAAQPYQIVLLMLAGIMTAVPLGLFSSAVNKLPLVTMGILEYIAPSIALILGIFVMKEPFDAVQFTAFAVVWVGLIFFTRGEFIENRSKE